MYPKDRDTYSTVRILHEDSAPRSMHFGEDFIDYKFPAGTRVLYPNLPMKPIENYGAAIRYALNHPEGDSLPLFAQLKPGMKVTIAIDDISLPLPPMATPDLRQLMLEIIIQMLEDHGVEDYEMIIALALHRRMTGPEIRRMVGQKIFDQYYPDRLYNMDAEDEENMVILGVTDHDEEVQIVRRVAESDLLIYVNINYVPMNGGYKSIGTGLSGYKAIRHHHNPETILKSDSYMDPDKSELYTRNIRQGMLLKENLNIFHIETAINNKMYDDPLAFFALAEDDWTTADQLKYKGIQAALKRLPRPLKRKIMSQVPAAYQLIGVFAGETEAVHKRTLQKCWQQHCVKVEGQADVLVYGIPYVSPYSVNSILNPLLVRCMALGYFFNMYRNKPLIKKGARSSSRTPVLMNLTRISTQATSNSLTAVCPKPAISKRLANHWEEEFAHNPNYAHMFSKGNAYHGVHPFYMWYWAENGQAHVGQVIVVGAENDHVPERLGWLSAKTMDEALDMARGFHGPSPEITMMHHPPFIVADMV